MITILVNFVPQDICLRQEDCAERSEVDVALTFISYVGMSVSIVSLFITITTLLTFK